MDPSPISILCDEFSCLLVEEQNEEIGKLFVLVGGIRIRRNHGEVSEEFRHRTFKKGLKNLPDDSGYEEEFFKERIIPSLIEDFKKSSVDTQEMLLDKLSDLTDAASIKRKTGESDRVRSYSQLLRKIPDGHEFEMVEFARQIGELEEDESDENQYDEEDESDEYDDESTSARKGDKGRRHYSGYDTQPVQEGGWNDGSKIAGFNPAPSENSKSTTSY